MEKKLRERDMEKLAEVWSESRCQAGKSQEYMASELGVARKTVQNWEKGVSAPTVDRAMEWFRVLGESPLPFLVRYIIPGEEEAQKRMKALLEGLTPKEMSQLACLLNEEEKK